MVSLSYKKKDVHHYSRVPCFATPRTYPSFCALRSFPKSYALPTLPCQHQSMLKMLYLFSWSASIVGSVFLLLEWKYQWDGKWREDPTVSLIHNSVGVFWAPGKIEPLMFFLWPDRVTYFDRGVRHDISSPTTPPASTPPVRIPWEATMDPMDFTSVCVCVFICVIFI